MSDDNKNLDLKPPARRGRRKTKTSPLITPHIINVNIRYFAVRKCDGLKAPAIFLCLEDCDVYIDKNEEYEIPPEFQEFQSLDAAKDYIQVFVQSSNSAAVAASAAAASAAAAKPKSKTTIATATATTTATTPSTRGRKRKAAATDIDTTNATSSSLPQRKSRRINDPKRIINDGPASSPKPSSSSSSSSSSPPPAPSRRKSRTKKGEKDRTSLTPVFKTKTKNNNKEPASSSSLEEEQQKWLDSFDDMIQRCRDYKEAFGDTPFVFDADGNSNSENTYPFLSSKRESNNQLGMWIQNARKFEKDVRRYLTQDQIKIMVEELGIMKSVEERRQEFKIKRQKKELNETWDEMMVKLNDYKTENGHVNIPLTVSGPEKDQFTDLYKWVKKVRRYMKEFYGDDNNNAGDNNDSNSSGCINQYYNDNDQDGQQAASSSSRWRSQSVPVSPLTEDQVRELENIGLQPLVTKDDKKRVAFDEEWIIRVEELKRFIDEHGHANVPIRNNGRYEDYQGLSTWLGKLRQQMKLFEKDPETSFLDEDKINLVENLGLPLKPKSYGKTAEEEEEEFEMFLKLLKTTTFETRTRKQNGRLHDWTAKQRREYNEFKNNRPSTMDRDRIIRLTEAGFAFESKKTKTWDERALNWLEYKTKHGKDPKRYEVGGLGLWVYSQRRKYRDMQEGLPANLTQEQIKKLTDWGFSWDSGYKRPDVKEAKLPWEVRFKQLVEYKEQHGHCMVPQHYPGLGQWVHGQRGEYRKMLLQKRNAMTQEKVDKLESIGFVFYTGKGGGVRTPESVARRLSQARLERDPFAHPAVDPHIMNGYRFEDDERY